MDNKNYFELGCHFAKDRSTSIHSWAEVIHEEAPVVLQWLVLDAAMGDKELKKSLLFAKNYGIQIILQVCLPQNEESKTNFEDQVQKWSSLGIQWIMPEGSPNMKAYWGNQWARGNILSSYYQMFRFFAKTSVDHGLSPILPILVPGGDIWDTIFLQSILNQLVAENEYAVIEKLALSSPAFTYERSLDWGMGGASKWVETKPYLTPIGAEDQIGINTYQWYLSLSKEILLKELPVFIFFCGWKSWDTLNNSSSEKANDEAIRGFLDHFKAEADQGFITKKPVLLLYQMELAMLKALQLHLGTSDKDVAVDTDFEKQEEHQKTTPVSTTALNHGQPHMPVIDLYVLLPSYDWGVSDWHLEVIQPFVKKHKATVGFSIQEASYAKKVIIVGSADLISDEQLVILQRQGCEVCRVDGDGTEIASKMRTF